MPLSIVYVLPASSQHGGNRVVLEQAAGLARRGHSVTIVSPEPPPEWHPVSVPFLQAALGEGGAIPAADVIIGTFWTTLAAVAAAPARARMHLCQGWEGVHREYAPILPAIDAAYRLLPDKLVVSQHLAEILEPRYGARCTFVGAAIDTAVFCPGPPRPAAAVLRIGVVGAYPLRFRGIAELFEGLALARAAGQQFELWRAATEPMTDQERVRGLTARYFERLDTAAMAELYRQLDAYIHPSFDEEGFGLPPLEAMACGAAVAVSDIAPARIYPADAVIRFPPGRPQVVPGVVAALADPARRRRLREAGTRFAAAAGFDPVLDRLEAAFAAAL